MPTKQTPKETAGRTRTNVTRTVPKQTKTTKATATKSAGRTAKTTASKTAKTSSGTTGKSTAKTSAKTTAKKTPAEELSLTAVEKRLVKAYRDADSKTRKTAMAYLQGKTDAQMALDMITGLAGQKDISLQDALSGILGKTGK